MSSSYEKYSSMNQEQLNQAFINACRVNDLPTVDYLLTSPELSRHAFIAASYDARHQRDEHSAALFIACHEGHIEVVKYLLTSPKLERRLDIATHQNLALRTACAKNHMELVKFLLDSPELNKHANPYDRAGECFLHNLDNIALLDYLFQYHPVENNSSKFFALIKTIGQKIGLLTPSQPHQPILTNLMEQMLEGACANGLVETLHYLLTSSRIGSNLVQAMSCSDNDLLDRCLRACATSNQVEGLKYILKNYDFDMEQNKNYFEESFLLACERNSRDFIDYFVNGTEKYNAGKFGENIFERALLTAIKHKHSGLVTYLVQPNEEGVVLADVNANDMLAFKQVCNISLFDVATNEVIQAAQAILHSPNFNHEEMLKHSEQLLTSACVGHHHGLIQFLVIEANITLSSTMEEYIKSSSEEINKFVASLLEKRELKESLGKNLQDTVTRKRMKI